MTRNIVWLKTNYKYKITLYILIEFIICNFIIVLVRIKHHIDQYLTNEHAKELLVSYVNLEMCSEYRTLIPLIGSIELSLVTCK